MKKSAPVFFPVIWACLALALACATGGCSLFHHNKKPKPWHPKPLGPTGAMEGNPQPMEAQPLEASPRPMEPVQQEEDAPQQ
ncbi:MAG TPA: hypothetical protein VG733_10830 [Chthoniobacteraceae bacterium]|nr:hypothetical protein [Chthoniobacteraceae bacterium]